MRYGSPHGVDLAPDPKVTSQECWIPAGQTTTIHGVTIPGGRLLVGRKLPSGEAYSLEPSLINPDLPVNLKNPANHEDTLGYWPQYHRISPEGRAGYLHFLASDRDDPSVPMGFVFLYFYGLERRLLVDNPAGEVSSEEYEDLIGEIQRLLSVYSHSNSLKGYASRLLDYLAMAESSFDTPYTTPITRERQNGLPSQLLVDLGIFSASHQPIPADWAYAWVIQDPQFRLRTAAERCPDEFKALFTRRYRERHGEGIVVKPNKTLITLSYHPASPSISPAPVQTQLPNITGLKKPTRLLAELVDRSCDELDAFSRFVGKHPSRWDSIEALALLPSSLAGERKTEEVINLEARLKARLQAQDVARVPFTELAAGINLGSTAKPTAKSMASLAGFLEQAGIGFEPDYRYTGILPHQDNDYVTFEIQSTSQLPVSPEFSHAATVMRLAGFVLYGQSDTLTELHYDILTDYLDQVSQLSELERQHLQAYFRWELERKSTLAGMRKRVDAMDASQRTQLEQLLVRLASADGVVDTDEIKKLRRTASLLGHDPETLYSRIHSAMAEPTVVRQASEAATGFSIPAPEPDAAQAGMPRQPLNQDTIRQKRTETQKIAGELNSIFTPDSPAVPSHDSRDSQPTGKVPDTQRTGRQRLDPAILQSKREESDQVTGVLNDIFTPEDEMAAGVSDQVPDDPRPLPASPSQGTVDTSRPDQTDAGPGGLNTAHMALLEAVATHEQGLAVSEAETLAGELHLLLAGAIDTINEAAFELTDAPVLEEEGAVLVVDSEILEEMKE
ncbi:MULTISPECIES: TerB N-terminal domain-containing protein [unclassified Chromohalobacter]|uniref:tellurite resistance TerB family protein n=1 Tax=Chromohalobacter sp. 48-RD10 TaxID=2994063 RepID=UPI002468FB45|nr:MULTISPECIES: TerB N-terminal domain-containing protein [unclassified Chromohalobacter]